MTKMTKISLLCLLMAFACAVQVTLAVPVPTENGHENTVIDDLITRLQQLRQLSEGQQNDRRASFPSTEGIYRVHRTLDNLGGGYLLKRNVESLGGGYLLKRSPHERTMDSLGGGYLL